MLAQFHVATMKAPRLELPSTPMLVVPLTPRGISPRTLSYICNRQEASSSALDVSGDPNSAPIDITLSLGPSPGSSTSTSSSELLIRSSCSPSSDTSASPSDSGSLSSSRSLSSSDKLGPLIEDDCEATSPKIPRFSSFSRLRLASKNCDSWEEGAGMGLTAKPPLHVGSEPGIHEEKDSSELAELDSACQTDFGPQGMPYEVEGDLEPPVEPCATPRGRPGEGFGRRIPRAPFSDGDIKLQADSNSNSNIINNPAVSSSFSSESSKSFSSIGSLSREHSDSSSSISRLGDSVPIPFGPSSLGLPMPPLPSGRPRITSSRSVDIGDMLGFKKGRNLERKSSDPDTRGKSPERSSHTSSGIPRFPSLSRLRLSSREPDGTPPSRPSCKLPPQLVTSVSGNGAGGSPRSRRAFGLASLKRKRPPMLDIPMKESFTASPLSTPERSSENSVEDIRELADEGVGYAVLSKRGKRREVMEDRFQAAQDLGIDSGLSFFGVYDGHGGTAAAEFVAKQLHLNVADSIKKNSPATYEAALVEAFIETDNQFLKKGVHSGSSCVTCLVTDSEVIVAHAGDCRAVMCSEGETICLTQDHKAAREDERQRIEALGGHVDDFTGTWRVQGIMAVTRGIGDQHLKEYITPVPETSIIKWKSKEDFIILASDGLWDVVSNEEATAVVSAVLHPGPRKAALQCENLALQLQALLSPTNSPAGSPSLPLSKRGFRSGSLSGDETPSQRERTLPESSSLKIGEDSATSERCRSSSDRTHTSLRLSKACRKLSDLAGKRGSYDDISVMILLPGAMHC